MTEKYVTIKSLDGERLATLTNEGGTMTVSFEIHPGVISKIGFMDNLAAVAHLERNGFDVLNHGAYTFYADGKVVDPNTIKE